MRLIEQGRVAVVLPLAGSNSRGGSVPRALVHLNGPEWTILNMMGEDLAAIRNAVCPTLRVCAITSRTHHEKIQKAISQAEKFGFSDDRFQVIEAESRPLEYNGQKLTDRTGEPIYTAFGHGDIPRAMHRHLDVLEQSGVKYLFYCHMNPLEHFLDPAFIGLAVAESHQTAVKMVAPDQAKAFMGRVAQTDNGRLICLAHHHREQHGDRWNKLHGNLGTKFFTIDIFKEAAMKALPKYTVRHYLQQPGLPAVIPKIETSILDVLNLSPDLGALEVESSVEHVSLKDLDDPQFRVAIRLRVERGLGRPLGWEL
jgi:UDP-N-acetylglucosamine pyrophosphorylase